jgi:hypothetical protein
MTAPPPPFPCSHPRSSFSRARAKIALPGDEIKPQSGSNLIFATLPLPEVEGKACAAALNSSAQEA